MVKQSPWVNIVGSVSLTLIAIWWLFFIVWNFGFVRFVQRLAFRSASPAYSDSAINAATTRAFEYATKGSTKAQDIFFGELEVSHLLDVSRLYQPWRIVLGVLALLSLTAQILIISTQKKLKSAMFVTARNILLSLALLVTVCLLFFANFFVRFHQLFFPQGNWAFPAQSMLIQLFPENFWKLLLGFVMAGLFGFVAIYHLAAKELRHE